MLFMYHRVIRKIILFLFILISMIFFHNLFSTGTPSFDNYNLDLVLILPIVIFMFLVILGVNYIVKKSIANRDIEK